MATVPKLRLPPESWYPDSDGKPVAETPQHRDNLLWLIHELQVYFAGDPMVYVSGNMFVYYVPANRRKHVSPDVFLVRGIVRDRKPSRRRFLVWEDRAPDVVVEFTSKSTRKEDLETKFQLYRDTLKVQEYFLFDPFQEYLDPPLRGYRLSRGAYVPIKPVRGRLPSKVLGLHLEREDWLLRVYDPATGKWLPTPDERAEQAEAALRLKEAEVQQAQALASQAEAARRQLEEALEQLQREFDALRRQLPPQG